MAFFVNKVQEFINRCQMACSPARPYRALPQPVALPVALPAPAGTSIAHARNLTPVIQGLMSDPTRTQPLNWPRICAEIQAAIAVMGHTDDEARDQVFAQQILQSSQHFQNPTVVVEIIDAFIKHKKTDPSLFINYIGSLVSQNKISPMNATHILCNFCQISGLEDRTRAAMGGRSFSNLWCHNNQTSRVPAQIVLQQLIAYIHACYDPTGLSMPRFFHQLVQLPIDPGVIQELRSIPAISQQIATVDGSARPAAAAAAADSHPLPQELVGPALPQAPVKAVASTALVPAGVGSDHLVVEPAFASIRSNSGRRDFLRLFGELTAAGNTAEINRLFPAPLIGMDPDLISPQMAEHLMRHKKHTALGKKFEPVDLTSDYTPNPITNMEALLHTFLVPVCYTSFTSDQEWFGFSRGAVGDIHPNGSVRPKLVAASIHADCETAEVVIAATAITQEAIETSEADAAPVIPISVEEKRDPAKFAAYEQRILRNFVYHNSPTHRRPALSEIQPGQILDDKGALARVEQTIASGNIAELNDCYMRTPGGNLVSLVLLANFYRRKEIVETAMCNRAAPQGYVPIIDPPSIFAQFLGDAKLLNRLQALGHRLNLQANPNYLGSMRGVAFNGYADSDMLRIYRNILPQALQIEGKPQYLKGRIPGAIDVVHNNSDGLGDNCVNEPVSSQDGLYGSRCTMACSLFKWRPDLMQCLYAVQNAGQGVQHVQMAPIPYDAQPANHLPQQWISQFPALKEE